MGYILNRAKNRFSQFRARNSDVKEAYTTAVDKIKLKIGEHWHMIES